MKPLQGVTNDVKATRDLLNNLNHPALLFVDGVSSIGSIKFEMDAWGLMLQSLALKKVYVTCWFSYILCKSKGFRNCKNC